MSLRRVRVRMLGNGFPRVSGDEPRPSVVYLEDTEFSPRERG